MEKHEDIDMNDRNFRQMLEAQWSRGNFVCVGLDSEFDKIPESAYRSGNECDVSVPNTLVAFNWAIVEATRDLVCAYKLNSAFYEAHGSRGIGALNRTIVDIQILARDVPIILDAKRGDIGDTSVAYAKAAFDYLHADAITVSPYFGAEALKPFLARAEKGIIVLCRTSNSGAGELQDVEVIPSADDERRWGIGDGGCESAPMKLYEYVAFRVFHDWNKNNNCALVVGATYPYELHDVRRIVGDMPILMPGVGFQQKDVPLEMQVEQVVNAGKDSRGMGMIINSGRSIIFASKGADYPEAARREALKLCGLINQYR